MNPAWKTWRHHYGLVLVLTFNRTLKGYIQELVEDQIQPVPNTHIDISTFASWSREILQYRKVLENSVKKARIVDLARSANISLPSNFIVEEIDYILGRFPANNLEQYLTAIREGRGTSPRVVRQTRQLLLDHVVYPYMEWKDKENRIDWNDLAIRLINYNVERKYEW